MSIIGDDHPSKGKPKSEGPLHELSHEERMMAKAAVEVYTRQDRCKVCRRPIYLEPMDDLDDPARFFHVDRNFDSEILCSLRGIEWHVAELEVHPYESGGKAKGLVRLDRPKRGGMAA